MHPPIAKPRHRQRLLPQVQLNMLLAAVATACSFSVTTLFAFLPHGSPQDVCRGDAAKFCVFKAIKEISYVMTIAVGNWFSPSEKVSFSDFTTLCPGNVLHPFREALISGRIFKRRT